MSRSVWLPILLLSSFYVSCSTAPHSRSVSSEATLSLPVIYDTDAANNKDVWKKVKRDDVPTSVIKELEIPVPSMAYQMPYSEVFLQDEYLVMCIEDCTQPQPFYPEKVDGNFVLKFKEGKHHKKQIAQSNRELLHMTTVYYWVHRLFTEMKDLGLAPEKRIEVYIDRDNLGMTDNAFYNPSDLSATFLPANHSLLYKLMGYKFKPTAVDPAVAMHEFSHYLFDMALEGRVLVNRSIASGLNEGFADYLALSVLDDEEMGILFAGGKDGGIRDYRPTSKLGKEIEALMAKGDAGPKRIEEMEEHDIGERIAYVLLRTKKLMLAHGLTKLEANQIFVNTVKEVFNNPFATVTDFVKAYARNIQKDNRVADLSVDAMKGFAAVGVTLYLPKANFAEVNSPALSEARGDKYVVVGITTIDKTTSTRQEFVKVGLLDRFASPSSASSTWFRMSFEGDDGATPFWIYRDEKTKQILNTFYSDGVELAQTDKSDLKKFSLAFGNFMNVIGFLDPMESPDLKELLGKRTRVFFFNAYKLKKEKEVLQRGVRFKDQVFDGYVESYDVKPSLLLKLFGASGYKIDLIWSSQVKAKSVIKKKGTEDTLVGYVIDYGKYKQEIMLLDAK